MARDRITHLAILLFGLLQAGGAAAQQGAQISWDFETPVFDFYWSSDVRSEYLYVPTSGGDFVVDTYLGPVPSDPLPSDPLALGAMDIFLFATPYTISFDLVIESLPPLAPSRVLTVTSHGHTIFQGVPDPADQIGGPGSFGIGASVFRVASLYSPGPVPVDGSASGCCGDIGIEWSLSGSGDWGIDNLVVTAVPEPGTALLLAVGIAWLATRR